MERSGRPRYKGAVKRARDILLCISIPLASIAACGGDEEESPALPDPGPDSGLATQTLIVDLSAEEIVVLCDWIAGRFGGYGRGIQCGDLGVASRENQSLCVADWAGVRESCALTVLDVEACINGAVDQDPCTELPSSCLVAISCA